METVSILRRSGLFDAKVPRYTSYPPANRFEMGTGQRYQQRWLEELERSEPVSIYVHIPFCRRLCWFCACRTQGTKTLSPVETYILDVIAEIDAISKITPTGLQMARLHLGGGTPTLLSGSLMDKLLDAVFDKFPRTDDFEFSVEIDPTDAKKDVLKVLADRGMNRASVGVQDFAPKVQKAIGRIQSYEVTHEIVTLLRENGIQSLNIDLLYGLPHQTKATMSDTLSSAITLNPDRLALYGYAHVPHISKRQIMIPNDRLPNVEDRFHMAQYASQMLCNVEYQQLGIDHFALPNDSLAIARNFGRMRRNFQGYTDDPCETLLGFGASAISQFKQGYVQNAIATAAYSERIRKGGLAGHKGIFMSAEEHLIGALISSLMCYGEIRFTDIKDENLPWVKQALLGLKRQFSDLLDTNSKGLFLKPQMWAAARLIAGYLDQPLQSTHIHSLAV